MYNHNVHYLNRSTQSRICIHLEPGRCCHLVRNNRVYLRPDIRLVIQDTFLKQASFLTTAETSNSLLNVKRSVQLLPIARAPNNVPITVLFDRNIFIREIFGQSEKIPFASEDQTCRKGARFSTTDFRAETVRRLKLNRAPTTIQWERKISCLFSCFDI